jgi:hypothetical protein
MHMFVLLALLVAAPIFGQHHRDTRARVSFKLLIG